MGSQQHINQVGGEEDFQNIMRPFFGMPNFVLGNIFEEMNKMFEPFSHPNSQQHPNNFPQRTEFGHHHQNMNPFNNHNPPQLQTKTENKQGPEYNYSFKKAPQSDKDIVDV